MDGWKELKKEETNERRKEGRSAMWNNKQIYIFLYNTFLAKTFVYLSSFASE
jgi:hypothetical protein